MRLAIAQINTTVGDLEGNYTLILEAVRRASDLGADTVLFPELATCGYPPQDLVTRPDFVSSVEKMNQRIAEDLESGPALILGSLRKAPEGSSRDVYNSALILDQGRLQGFHDKILLPTYDVFDEARTFEPGGVASVHSIRGKKVGIAICEDLWTTTLSGQPTYSRDPGQELVEQGAEILLSPSASPFHAGRKKIREQVFAAQSKRWGVPICLANLVGGNTELIFDGGSFLMDPDGSIERCPSFSSHVALVGGVSQSGLDAAFEDTNEESLQEIADALILGISDFFQKCSHETAVLGLSGGIDSAVAALLAVEALGSGHVRGVGMPGPYSSIGSQEDAVDLAQRLGIDFQMISIQESYTQMRSSLEPVLGTGDWGVAQENLQSRIRGTTLMTLANSMPRAMVLATGNKSELSVGYCTLYGDMCGGLAPLGDLSKQQVYGIARLEKFRGRIPDSTLDKPPSAELAPDQVDTDSLPPYEQLDAILSGWVEQRLSFQEIVDLGIPEESVRSVIRLIEISEHKRRQSAPILRVSARAYGVGRRVPIARSLDGWQLPS
ncbi:MAG: NAD+ synthase [Planctomycetia bacterium]|nr:NAD+ synthase [Planctomycetia bacterium]